MNNRITIIIATYNASQTLRRCLESVVCQLTDECELLVIDGGSTDGTQNIIEEFKDNISYTVSEPDEGVYDAWNKGIKASTGKWIAFIGADDVLLPYAIEHYMNFFKENGEGYDVICGKLHLVDEHGNILRDVGEPWNWAKMAHRTLKFAHPGMLHNRKCFERIGLFDTRYKICADSDFLQRLGSGTKAGYLDEFLVNMQKGGISDSLAALKEGYLTRKNNHVLNPIVNLYEYAHIYLRYRIGKVLRSLKLTKR